MILEKDDNVEATPSTAVVRRTRSADGETSEQTSPDDSQPSQQRFIVETITMTTVTERRIVREAGDTSEHVNTAGATAPHVGILKGGKMWRNSSEGTVPSNANTSTPSSAASTTTTNNGEAVNNNNNNNEGETLVRFTDEDLAPTIKDVTDEVEDTTSTTTTGDTEDVQPPPPSQPPPGELTLTFRLGSSVLLSGAVQRPNSAIRQLFPSQRFAAPPAAPGEASLADDDEDPLPQPFVITAETLRQLDDTRRPRFMRDSSNSAANGDIARGGSLRRAIERNTLRRSLQARNRRANQAARQDSLVERIRQLTCDVDDNPPATSPTEEARPELEGTSDTSADGDHRTSPQGEEAHQAALATTQPSSLPINHVKTSSGSSSSSSSVTSTYKKLSDLFGRRSTDRYDRNSQLQNEPLYQYYPTNQSTTATSPPDLGNGPVPVLGKIASSTQLQKVTSSRSSGTAEARKQFLSTLAPLAACVAARDADANPPLELAPLSRHEYTVEDIDQALASTSDEKPPQPDVVVGTQVDPNAAVGNAADELALFVQRDHGRIERIRKRYSLNSSTASTTAGSDVDDDEHDDYGFNRRPSVRGIRPRFGTTQEMTHQSLPPCPAHHWSNVTNAAYTTGLPNAGSQDDAASQAEEPTYSYIPSDMHRVSVSTTGVPNASGYVTATNSSSSGYATTEYAAAEHQHAIMYATGVPTQVPSSQAQQLVMRIGGGTQAAAATVSPYATYHQGRHHGLLQMRLTPGAGGGGAASGAGAAVGTGTTTGAAATASVCLTATAYPAASGVDPQYATLPLQARSIGTPASSVIRLDHGHQQTIRLPYPGGAPLQVHLLATARREDSPQRFDQQVVIARGTQTAAVSYFHQDAATAAAAAAAAASAAAPRGPLVFQETPSPLPVPNIGSPTRSCKLASYQSVERGVPEGAASSSPALHDDGLGSPTVAVSSAPPPSTSASSVYYAMNV